MEGCPLKPETLSIEPEKGHKEQARLVSICKCYKEDSQLVDLDTFHISDQLLILALEQMSERRSDYAQHEEVDYKNAFNWDRVLTELGRLAREAKYSWPQSRQYHVIAYYSQLEPGMATSNESRFQLGSLDEAAFREALEIGGLMKYWFGEPDGQHRNLATCEHEARLILIRLLTPAGIWRSREEANAVRDKQHHAKAKQQGFNMYRNILIQELELTVEAGLGDLKVDWKRNAHVKSDSHGLPGTYSSGRATNSLL